MRSPPLRSRGVALGDEYVDCVEGGVDTACAILGIAHRSADAPKKATVERGEHSADQAHIALFIVSSSIGIAAVTHRLVWHVI